MDNARECTAQHHCKSAAIGTWPARLVCFERVAISICGQGLRIKGQTYSTKLARSSLRLAASLAAVVSVTLH